MPHPPPRKTNPRDSTSDIVFSNKLQTTSLPGFAMVQPERTAGSTSLNDDDVAFNIDVTLDDFLQLIVMSFAEATYARTEVTAGNDFRQLTFLEKDQRREQRKLFLCVHSAVRLLHRTRHSVSSLGQTSNKPAAPGGDGWRSRPDYSACFAS